LVFNLALRMLLVISIVLQSITGVVSATPGNHQIDIEHLQTQHNHQNDINLDDISKDDQGHDVKDCHHCGHCSGSHLSWISVHSLSSTLHFLNTNKTPYQFDQTKEFLDAILRPPIA